MSHLKHTYAVILAGGGGTRLWPKSRTATPKQFLKLFGDRTMMQQAVDRIAPLIDWDHIIVVTNSAYKDEVARQLPKVPKEHIIAEPAKRDTALAMLVGSVFAKNLDPEAVIINIASDHLVPDQDEFLKVVRAASGVAHSTSNLVTVGISPTRPATGFGYICIGDELQKLDDNLPLFQVESFREKPNEETARAFIATGKYFWNANMYVWSAKTLLDAFKKHYPQLHTAVQPLLGEHSAEALHKQLAAIYDAAETISIDYAISEKADNLVLIPGDFGWDDVGDWKVTYELKQKDENNNVLMSDSGNQAAQQVLAIDSTDNLLHTTDRLVALVGVSGMVVVDTPEILMIVPKERSQEVKKIVTALKESKTKKYL